MRPGAIEVRQVARALAMDVASEYAAYEIQIPGPRGPLVLPPVAITDESVVVDPDALELGRHAAGRGDPAPAVDSRDRLGAVRGRRAGAREQAALTGMGVALIHRMQEKLSNGASTFEHRLDALKDSVRHLASNSGQRAKSVATSSGRMIKGHPLIAVAIVAGIGLGVGVFMMMRRR